MAAVVAWATFGEALFVAPAGAVGGATFSCYQAVVSAVAPMSGYPATVALSALQYPDYLPVDQRDDVDRGLLAVSNDSVSVSSPPAIATIQSTIQTAYQEGFSSGAGGAPRARNLRFLAEHVLLRTNPLNGDFPRA